MKMKARNVYRILLYYYVQYILFSKKNAFSVMCQEREGDAHTCRHQRFPSRKPRRPNISVPPRTVPTLPRTYACTVRVTGFYEDMMCGQVGLALDSGVTHNKRRVRRSTTAVIFLNLHFRTQVHILCSSLLQFHFDAVIVHRT